MAIADKLLQVNQVKQDIKTAIETKGIPMTNVAFTEYANKILDISDFPTISYDETEYFGWSYYMFYRGGHQSLFANTWNNHNKRTTLFDGNISFVTTDSSLGMPLSFYTGAGIDELYDLLASGGAKMDEALKITVNDIVLDATSIDSVANTNISLRYVGDQSAEQSIPTPVYAVVDKENTPFLIVVNTTELGMPLGKAIAFIGIEGFNYLKIESGFNHYYENGIIIPDGVEIIPAYSYYGVIGEYLRSNNFPLVIPNSVTSIDNRAFFAWEENNQPLVIPNSVTSIEYGAFYGWISNNQPLVIPNSVTSIGSWAFYNWSLVPYIEIQAITPPTLSNINAFDNQNDAPIYVPNDSVDDYKTATNWVDLADRIFPISDK